ncbi:MAG: repeat protein [Flaviaesturariibacter sp.]|nr:repeat protein [Flaviaesturariibacter sp.]
MFKKSLFIVFAALAAGITSKAQVNYQRGSAEQTFPLISYTDSKSGLSTGVAAVYSSGNGLQVNDLASNLGTGWALQAGGMVSRIQNGLPDDQMERTGVDRGPESLKRYGAGYMYSPAAGIGCPEALTYYVVFANENVVYKPYNIAMADTEQDRFVFSMNGHSGTFVIGKNGTIKKLGDSRVNISYSTADMTNDHIRTRISAFTITTEDGIKYHFTAKNLTRITRYKYSEYRNGQWYPISYQNMPNHPYAVNRFAGEPLPLEERPYIVSGWSLTEIENPNSGDKILFEYERTTQEVLGGKYISHERDLNKYASKKGILGGMSLENWFSYLANPANADAYATDPNLLGRLAPSTTTVTYMKSINEHQRIKKIIFPNGGFVDFNYFGFKRKDLPGENPLYSIEYFLNGKRIRGYQFKHGYFFKNTIRGLLENFTPFEEKFARLCLISITKLGSDEDEASEPPYKFQYYTGSLTSTDDIIPARNSLSQDHWGYYNGSLSGLPATEDHDFLSDPQNQYFKAVLMNSHTPKVGYAKNGLLKNVTYPTGGTLTYNYTQNYSRPVVTAPSATDKIYGGVSVESTVLFDGSDPSKNIVTNYYYRTPNGGNNFKTSRWGYENPAYTNVSHTEYDEDHSRYKHPGIEFPEMAVKSPSASFNLGAFLLNTAVSMAVNQILTAVFSAAAATVIGVAVAVVGIVIALIKKFEDHHYYKFILTNYNSAMANPIEGISRVEVHTNSPTGYNGKTVYDFTDTKDYFLYEPAIGWPFAPKQRMAPWAFGLTKKVTVFDKNNLPVSESNNTYDFISEKIANQNNVSCKCATRFLSSKWSRKWPDATGIIGFNQSFRGLTPLVYYQYSGRTDLRNTVSKQYVNGSLYQENATSVATDPALLLQRGKIVQKDPSSFLYQISYYPEDYTIGGAIQKLKENNAVHTPVATETWLLKLDQTNPFMHFMYLINANVNEYKLYNIGGKEVVKPWKTYALKTDRPISLGSIGHQASDKSVLLRHPEFFKETNEFIYDDNGNLIETRSNDQVTSFINDYSNRYVVATVANAAYENIAYTSFESNGNGRWTYDQSGISDRGITGYKSYLLEGNTISIDRLSGGMFTVTYWIKDAKGSANINGGEGQLLYQGVDGWNLYKHELELGESITITGNGYIDELRLYPSGAFMSTVAYKEGIGKITECDANNRLLFYEYDGLGRLKLIRDQSKNIIKTYEYNYKK